MRSQTKECYSTFSTYFYKHSTYPLHGCTTRQVSACIVNAIESSLYYFAYVIFVATQEVHQKKLTMSFEEYKNLSNMLVLYMRNEENRVETDTMGMLHETITFV